MQPLLDPFALQVGQVQALQQILGLDHLTISEPAKGKVSQNYSCSSLRYHNTENSEKGRSIETSLSQLTSNKRPHDQNDIKNGMVAWYVSFLFPFPHEMKTKLPVDSFFDEM